MSDFLHDLRHALRMLLRTPGFAAVAILTLSLGIGANTAIFTLIDALFYQPLPVLRADRLVEVHQTQGRDPRLFELAYADYPHYRDRARAFSALAAHYPLAPLHVVTTGAEPESRAMFGSVVTWNYFAVLGLVPAAGRFFQAEEDRVPGRDAVAVIGYDMWQSRFAGDPQAVGTHLSINGALFTVIGVAPRHFHGVTRGIGRAEIWIPTAMFGVGYRGCNAFERSCRIVDFLGRLNDAQTVASAQTEMAVLAGQLAAAHPETHRDRSVRVSAARGVRQEERAAYGPTAALLAVTVGLVLLSACANLTGLLLARGVRRRKEIAVRLALGAGRARLVRQLLTESLAIALLGGAGGLVVAGWTGDILARFYGTSPSGSPLNFDLQMNGALLAITFLLSILTALLIGVIPAWQATRPAIAPVLKSEGLPGGATGGRLRDGLIVLQVALAVVLVAGAALLMRSVRHLYQGPGFAAERIALLRIRPTLIGYDSARARAFHEEVVRRMAALPGVVSASHAVFPPLPGWGATSPLWLPGQQPADPNTALQTRSNSVGPRYFQTLGAPLLEGREFTDRDRNNAPRVIIVSNTLARLLWPEGSAIGRSVMADGAEHIVVGVAPDLQYQASTEPTAPFFYTSYWQRDRNDVMALESRLHVHVTGDPRAMLPQIRRVIQSVDAHVPISDDQALVQSVAFEFRTVRGASTLLMWLSGLALFLSTMGLYAVLAFTVSQRTRELAIRVALGATQARVARLVVSHGAALAGLGSVIGLGAAFAATKTLRNLLYGVQSNDPIVLLCVPVLLISVALAASYFPARRASRVDPLVALRFD